MVHGLTILNRYFARRKGTWNNIKINDPCPVVLDGVLQSIIKERRLSVARVYNSDAGVSFADDLRTAASPINPVINSGHETCIFPWKEGVAAMLDGPEKILSSMHPVGILK